MESAPPRSNKAAFLVFIIPVSISIAVAVTIAVTVAIVVAEQTFLNLNVVEQYSDIFDALFLHLLNGVCKNIPDGEILPGDKHHRVGMPRQEVAICYHTHGRCVEQDEDRKSVV